MRTIMNVFLFVRLWFDYFCLFKKCLFVGIYMLVKILKRPQDMIQERVQVQVWLLFLYVFFKMCK